MKYRKINSFLGKVFEKLSIIFQIYERIPGKRAKFCLKFNFNLQTTLYNLKFVKIVQKVSTEEKASIYVCYPRSKI